MALPGTIETTSFDHVAHSFSIHFSTINEVSNDEDLLSRTLYDQSHFEFPGESALEIRDPNIAG